MRKTAAKIRQIEGLLTFGAPLTYAVAKALGCTLTEFAERNGVRQPELSMCLSGYYQRTYPKIRDAICRELAIPREYLDRLIDQQRSARDAICHEFAIPREHLNRLLEQERLARDVGTREPAA